MNIPDYQLNLYLANVCPCFDAVSKWIRADVGNIEAYVGDGNIVIAVISVRPPSVEEMTENCQKAKPVVIRYLQSEGFLGADYVYVAIQELDLQNPPDGLQCGE